MAGQAGRRYPLGIYGGKLQPRGLLLHSHLSTEEPENKRRGPKGYGRFPKAPAEDLPEGRDPFQIPHERGKGEAGSHPQSLGAAPNRYGASRKSLAGCGRYKRLPLSPLQREASGPERRMVKACGLPDKKRAGDLPEQRPHLQAALPHEPEPQKAQGENRNHQGGILEACAQDAQGVQPSVREPSERLDRKRVSLPDLHGGQKERHGEAELLAGSL